MVLSHSSHLLIFLYKSGLVLLWKMKCDPNDFCQCQGKFILSEPVVQVLAICFLAIEFQCVVCFFFFHVIDSK